jgi:hypothetical protein
MVNEFASSPENNATRAPAPGASMYTTTPAAPAQTFSSMGGSYSGFQTVNNFNNLTNYVDLTIPRYQAPADPYTYVDPARAQEDLKALLEGAIEDEDEQPRTRSRKKKEAEANDLVAKLQGLNVDQEEEKIAVTSDDEEEEEEDDGTVEGIKVKLLPHQVEGLEWMKGREIGTGKKGVVPKGGILGKARSSVSFLRPVN